MRFVVGNFVSDARVVLVSVVQQSLPRCPASAPTFFLRSCVVACHGHGACPRSTGTRRQFACGAPAGGRHTEAEPTRGFNGPTWDTDGANHAPLGPLLRDGPGVRIRSAGTPREAVVTSLASWAIPVLHRTAVSGPTSHFFNMVTTFVVRHILVCKS